MQQCNNCGEWAEDLIDIVWPCEHGQNKMAVYWVCVECFDHLFRIECKKISDLPEIGSEAAQRGYRHSPRPD